MNQLVGHLRPEPIPAFYTPNPSVSKLRQSSAGQGGQRQFSFFPYCLYYLAPGAQGTCGMGNGGGGSEHNWVKIKK